MHSKITKIKIKKQTKKTRHGRLYATFSIFLHFYLRFVGVNWQWTLTLCGMKLKPEPVLALAWWYCQLNHVTLSQNGFWPVNYTFLTWWKWWRHIWSPFVESARFSFTPCIKNEITAGVGWGVGGLAHYPHPLRTIYVTIA